MASEERDFTKTPLVEKWSVKEVTDFIKTLPGLSELAPIFEENDIDGGMLFGLTDEELEKSLHIKSFGKRKKFLEEIRKRKRHSYLDEKRDELISSDLSTTTAADPRDAFHSDNAVTCTPTGSHKLGERSTISTYTVSLEHLRTGYLSSKFEHDSTNALSNSKEPTSMFGTVGQEDHHSTAAHRDNGRKLTLTATRTPASEPVIEPAGISCDRMSLAEAESDGQTAALTPGISDTLHSTRTISTSSTVAVKNSLHSNAAAMMPVVPKDEDLRATDEVTSLRSTKETGEVSIKQTLRTYQEELIDKINNTRGKTRNVIVCAPTGSGKTLVAAKHCADVITAVRCDGKPTACVYFIVPTNHLAHQQAKYMNETLDGIRHVGLITGDQTEETTLSEQSQISDIVVMTPEILLNDLKKNKTKLSDIQLLVFDECHHTDKKHPYMQIMDLYLKEKFGETEAMGSLPQILGMTATLGMGSVSSLEDAKSHVLTLCANLDSAEIVQVLDNCDELYEYVPYPNTELMAVGKREMEDPFHKEIVKVMKEIQHKADPPETCHEYGSQEYETIINQHRRTLEEGENYEALFYVNMLISYNQGLQIYRYMGKEETLDFFKEKFSSGEPGEGRAKLIRTMENERKSIAEQLQQLEAIRSFPNPKLEALKRLLLDEFDKSTTAKGIVFMTTRQLTGALVKWIKTDEHLRDRVRSKQLVGAHGNSEMNQLNKAEQLQAIQEFRGGNCNLLVATTIGEEGLDIPKCHFVVRYDLVTSEIAEVQARGRARVCQSSRFVEIVTQGSANEDRAKANKHREKLMNEASASVRYMPEKELLNEIQKRQMERLRKLRDKAKQLQARHESNSPADVTLHCKKCGVTACQGSDILCIGTQHVVLGTCLDEKIKKDHMKSPDKYCKTGKISCKDCGVSWGSLTQFVNGKELPILRCKQFQFSVSGNKNFMSVRQWKDVPFCVKRGSEDDLN